MPDLAIEVISRGNTKREMENKLEEYFEAGAKLVWYVYAKKSTVTVYTSPADSIEFTIGEALDGGDVLPGFKLPLAELFDESKLQG